MKRWRVIIASLAVGAAAGWFAAGAWGNCGKVELCNCGNVETANDGRARSPVSPERSEPRKRWLQGCAPTEKAKPRRKALIRSSADAEVQEKVLRGRIADLKKRLEFARRESEALAEARRRLSKDGIYRAAKNLEEVWLQSLEAKKALGKEDGKATIGEMRALAPDWWDHTEKDILSGRYDDRLKGVRRVLGILTSVDRSMMTPDELKVHDAFVEKLSAAQEADAVLLDGITDGTAIGEMYKAFEGTFAQYRDVDFKAERSALIDMISRAYGLADGDAARFSSVFKDVDGALQDVPAGSFEDFRKSFKDGKTAGSQAHGETEVSK